MAPRRSSLKAFIRSPLATIHQGQLHDPTKQSLNEKQDQLEHVRSGSSGGHSHPSTFSDALAHNRDAQRLVRSIPPWVHTRSDLQGEIIGAPLFPAPNDALIAHHNGSPSSQRRQITSSHRSRAEDEDWVPPWPGATPDDTLSRWAAFKSATEYPRVTPNGGRIVSPEWWRENGPDYDQPWLADREPLDSEDGAMIYKHGFRRKAWYQRFERTILRSPIVPMILRMIVLGFSVMALGLASSIHHLANDSKAGAGGQSPSTDMAIIVDAIAIVYLLYITYDEYSGKPLGLRSARAKMRLIFLDLFFIVFDSANLSIAFVATRSKTCEIEVPGNDEDCSASQTAAFNEVLQRQNALASVLLIALIAWMLTFSISITRLVEKMTHR